MAERREAQTRGEAVRNPAEFSYLRELNRYLTRMVKAVTEVENGPIPDTFMSPTDHQTVRRILRETIDRIQIEKKNSEHKAVTTTPTIVAPLTDEDDAPDKLEDDGPRLTIVNSKSELTVNTETFAAKPNQEQDTES